jgi:predicted amidohydrolase
LALLEPYLAATVQFEPTLGDKAGNIDGLVALVEQAARQGARLVVTPEMGTTGYCWFDRAEVAPHVEPIPGPTTARFAAAAADLDIHIVIGMPEVEPCTGLYYNSAVLIGPQGVIGRHRKTHVYISEPKWAAPGDLGHQVFETPLGRIALLICMDIHFIETARLVALAGADVICHISNWLAERTPAPYWITRGFENGCYVIEANRWGLERTVQFSGGSCIIAPDGEAVATIDAGDGLALGAVDLDLARRRTVLGEAAFAARRPELYAELAMDAYLWNPLDFFSLYGHRPLPPGRRSRIAVAQFLPADDPAANLRHIAALAGRAAAGGIELLVLPELALCGLQAPGQRAEAIDGPSVRALLAVALRWRLHLVAGLAERAGDALYNAAVVVGPEGIAGRYRKIHLTAADQTWAKAGDEWLTVDLPMGRVGILLGFDAVLPESARVLALRGADVLACPAALAGRFTGGHPGSRIAQNYPIPTGADPYHWHLLRARAGENNVWLAFANVAEPYAGQSGVFGPDTFAFPRREAIVQDDEGLASLDIDTGNLDTPYPTSVVRRKDLVAMRQPHHYQPLVGPGRLVSPSVSYRPPPAGK